MYYGAVQYSVILFAASTAASTEHSKTLHIAMTAPGASRHSSVGPRTQDLSNAIGSKKALPGVVTRGLGDNQPDSTASDIASR